MPEDFASVGNENVFRAGNIFRKFFRSENFWMKIFRAEKFS